MTPLLRVTGLTVGYGGAPVLERFDLDVARGTCVAVVGPNGAGKSTLIRCLIGQIAPAEGDIAIDGRGIVGLAPEKRAAAGLSLVPEGRRVFAGLTVAENLDVASVAGRAGRRIAKERVFDLFPILAERRATRAWQLSGGQQQMLAIGRALMTEPKLILMDEPTLGLAPVVARDVAAAIARIAAAGAGVLIAEQNKGRLAGLAAEIVELG